MPGSLQVPAVLFLFPVDRRAAANTTLRLIAGFEAASEGEILLNGACVNRPPA